MALISAAFITLTQAKQYLGLDTLTTAGQTFLEDCIGRATYVIEGYLGKGVKARQYTEYYNGDGTDVLFVKNFPIVNVTTLYDDVNRAYSAGTLITSTDYIVYENKGMVALVDDCFQCEQKNIKVIYTGGYASGAIPMDLQQACCDVTRVLYEKQDAGMQSESIGQYSYTRANTGMDFSATNGVKYILDRYRIPSFPWGTF